MFPYNGKKPIADIKPLELLNVLRRIEGRGATEKARKVRQCCGEVFRYAIVTGRAEYNPAPDLTSAMQGHESNHFPFLTPKELPDFFNALSGYSGSELVVFAARCVIKSLSKRKFVQKMDKLLYSMDFNNRLKTITALTGCGYDPNYD